MKRPLCTNCRNHLASGMWQALTKKGRVFTTALCASCGLTDLANRVRMIDMGADEPLFYRDIARIDLLVSFTRDNDDTQHEPAPLSIGTAALIRKKNASKFAPRIAPQPAEWSYRNE